VRDVYVGGEPALLGGAAAPGRVEDGLVVREFRAAAQRLWG
jgi:hypothetical protein